MNKFDNRKYANKKENDSNVTIEKRRISCLGIIIILFSFFSFFTFFGDKDIEKNKLEDSDIKKVEDKKDTKENLKINNDNINKIPKPSQEENKDINDNITNEIRDEVNSKVKLFFSAYLGNVGDLDSRLSTISDVCTYDYYESLKEELTADRLKKNENYHERVVKDIKVDSMEAVNDGSILIKAVVTSEWLNKDKNYIDNEMLEYNIQLINEDGAWKIIRI